MARVLIVGATSAIAASVATQMGARGDALYLLGRSRVKLDALVSSLGSAVVGATAADFDDLDDNARRMEEAIEALGGVDIAIFAHGLLGDQMQSEREFAVAAQTIRTNFSSMVSLLIPVANAMEGQGRGRIGVMSSVAGERGRPRNYTYGAAKGALTIYLQGLRSRLWRAGVAVHTFKLGPVDTPMTATHHKTRLFANADDVARGIMDRLDRGSGEAFLPWFWAPIMTVVRALPEPLFQRLKFLSGR